MTVPRIAELKAPAAWDTVDFISDLHLSADEPATFAAWQRYLQSSPADAVFMLGDLFEVWVGDDAASADPSGACSFEAQCAQIMRLASQRKALFFMHGNRDFLVGQALMERCGASLLEDPTVLHFAGRRWLLSHGDALCLADTDYLQFRQQVRSAAWQAAFLSQSLDKRKTIAQGLRAQSETRRKSAPMDADVDAEAARGWLRAAGADTLVHGHTHRPGEHDLGEGLSRVVLSDWDAAAKPARAEVLRLTASGLQRLPLPAGPSP
jgi:UDP-2,3-diacylglucosamine hydrolase